MKRIASRSPLLRKDDSPSVVKIEIFNCESPNVLLYIDSDKDYLVFSSVDDAVSFVRNNYKL